jgi:hypothetical protein
VKQYLQLPCINRYGEVVMSLLEDTVTLKGLKGTITVTALFDSGASYSCIKRAVAEQIAVLLPLEEPMEFELADENATVTAEYVVNLSFYFQDTDRRFTDEFIVLDSLSEDLIVGAKTMQSWKIRLDFDKEEILYDRKMHKLRL